MATGWRSMDRLLHRAMASGPGGRMMRTPRVHAALSAGNAGVRRLRGTGRRLTPRHRAVARANPASPTLGVAMMVQDSAEFLPLALSPALLALVDDVVVLDGGSRDDTPAVAKQLGARVVDAPWPEGGFGVQQTRAARASVADWVLILDSDEVVSAALLASLPDLIRTRAFSGWWLPRRWIVRLGNGFGFLAGRPHWPDHQARLARRTPDLEYRGAMHPTLSSATAGPWGVVSDTALLHLDFLLNDRAARERKVAARSRLAGFAGTEGFYLWEDHPRRIASLGAEDAAIVQGLGMIPAP